MDALRARGGFGVADAAGGIGDADPQERKPGQADVGVDALFRALLQRPEVDILLMSHQQRSASSSWHTACSRFGP